jgi:hypothetical protein
MILRCVVITPGLVIGLATGPSTRTVFTQNLTEPRSAV